MKRSRVNSIIRDGDAFIRSHGFRMPPFAYWTAESWKSRGSDVSQIMDNQLGWDITDFGLGNYESKGLFLFTIRNGSPENIKSGEGKLYAEKIMIVGVDQITPLHFHWQKVEDIINRGGGELMIELYNSTSDEQLADTDVSVWMDGVHRVVRAGGTVSLSPGESITLPTGCYHKFWGTEDRVLVGEVSTVNDDNTDNRFYEPIGRFAEIEEDEPPLHLLVTDYKSYYCPGA